MHLTCTNMPEEKLASALDEVGDRLWGSPVCMATHTCSAPQRSQLHLVAGAPPAATSGVQPPVTVFLQS